MNSSTLKIGIAYEDVHSCIRARQLAERVTSQLQEFESDTYLWRFDLLDAGEAGAEAAREASVADLIIVSAHDCLELPANVYAWLESWLPRRKNREAALVALSSGEAMPEWRPVSPFQDSLKNLAERWGVDFFCETDWSPAMQRQAPDRSHEEIVRHSLSQEVLRHAPGWQHWGINE